MDYGASGMSLAWPVLSQELDLPHRLTFLLSCRMDWIRIWNWNSWNENWIRVCAYTHTY